MIDIADVMHIYDNTLEPYRIFKKRKTEYWYWENAFWNKSRIESLTKYLFYKKKLDEYIVNGRSALGWLVDQYQVSPDKASGIVNDPNDWAREHDYPRYIFDLVLRIIELRCAPSRL